MVNRERKIIKLYPQRDSGIYATASIPTEESTGAYAQMPQAQSCTEPVPF